eukprot:4803134-Pyramimonas_sp.AAC.1
MGPEAHAGASSGNSPTHLSGSRVLVRGCEWPWEASRERPSYARYRCEGVAGNYEHACGIPAIAGANKMRRGGEERGRWQER